jgi:hypothetical protein
MSDEISKTFFDTYNGLTTSIYYYKMLPSICNIICFTGVSFRQIVFLNEYEYSSLFIISENHLEVDSYIHPDKR